MLVLDNDCVRFYNLFLIAFGGVKLFFESLYAINVFESFLMMTKVSRHTFTETERSSIWLHLLSLETWKASFNVPSDDLGSHLDYLSVSLLEMPHCKACQGGYIARRCTKWCLATRGPFQSHRLIYLPVWASSQMRNIAGTHAPGMAGTFSPPPQVSDPDMHHGTCVTHVPWCLPGSLTSSYRWSRRRGKTFPAFPAHAQPAIVRIW